MIEEEKYENEVEDEIEEDRKKGMNKRSFMYIKVLSIVMQCNLRVAIEEIKEDWLRTNIFHTRCTTKRRVCLTIIDSSNFKDVVSEEMVQKLDLKIVPHPNLYKLHWLQKGNEIKVKHCCLISFSIGSLYKDEVWCDVAATDAYHLLLGRP